VVSVAEAVSRIVALWGRGWRCGWARRVEREEMRRACEERLVGGWGL